MDSSLRSQPLFHPPPASGATGGQHHRSAAGRVVAIYIGFSVVVMAIFLGLDAGSVRGAALLAAVVGFHVALAIQTRAFPEAHHVWRFLLPLSALMIFPDWVLSSLVGSLGFRDGAAIGVGAVPLYMGGAWSIALLPLLLIAATMRGKTAARIVAAGGAVRVPWLFATSEDFRSIPGGASIGLQLAHRYLDAVVAAAGTHREIQRRYVEVIHLLRSPLTFLAPQVLRRIIAGVFKPISKARNRGIFGN